VRPARPGGGAVKSKIFGGRTVKGGTADKGGNDKRGGGRGGDGDGVGNVGGGGEGVPAAVPRGRPGPRIPRARGARAPRPMIKTDIYNGMFDSTELVAYKARYSPTPFSTRLLRLPNAVLLLRGWRTWS